jgi:hypothetical protein
MRRLAATAPCPHLFTELVASPRHADHNGSRCGHQRLVPFTNAIHTCEARVTAASASARTVALAIEAFSVQFLSTRYRAGVQDEGSARTAAERGHDGSVRGRQIEARAPQQATHPLQLVQGLLQRGRTWKPGS